jgi:hypothetical protein
MEQERDFAEAKFTSHGLGYSDKDIVQGMAQIAQYAHTNVHSVSQVNRERDAARYEHIPMIGDNKDPMLNAKIAERVDNLFEALVQQLPEMVNRNELRKRPSGKKHNPLSAVTSPAAAVTATAVDFTAGITNTLYGIEYDISHWADLPGATATEKAQHVFVRDSRLRYLLYIIIPLMIIIIMARCLT